jgi:hypothetical protein
METRDPGGRAEHYLGRGIRMVTLILDDGSELQAGRDEKTMMKLLVQKSTGIHPTAAEELVTMRVPVQA